MNNHIVFELKNCRIFNESVDVIPFSIEINKFDICQIESQNDELACIFLKSLATLCSFRGELRFNGVEYDPLDYLNLLDVKRKIAYLGSSCALLSNRSIIENIQLFRMWEENTLRINTDEEFMAKCKSAGIYNHLKLRPKDLAEELRSGIFIIREFLKKPELVVLERPYLFTRGNLDTVLRQELGYIYKKGVPLVFYSTTGFIPRKDITHIIRVEKDKIEKIAR